MNRTTFLATSLVGTFAFALTMCVEPYQKVPAPEPIVQAKSEQIGRANSMEIEEKAARDILEKYFANLEPRYEFSAPEDVTTESIAGDYYQGDGLGYNLGLKLNQNGEFSATWHGCLGLYGTASGTWKISASKLSLTSTKEADMLVGHLRELSILNGESGPILVRPDDLRYLRHVGERRSSCLRRVSNNVEPD